MIIDIACGVVILLAALHYSRRGFATSILYMLQWFLCLVVGLLFCDNITRLLVNHTGVGAWMDSIFQSKLDGSDAAVSQVGSVYDVFQGYTSSDIQIVTDPGASDLTQIVLAIFSFVAILAVLKVALWLFCRIFPKEKYDGMAGFLDHLSGVVFGTAMGFLYILILLTFLLALMAVVPSGTATAISNSLENSYVTGSMYQSNPFLLLIRNLFA